MSKKKYINVIAQQFYGNRTTTYICTEDIDFFLRGSLNTQLALEEDNIVNRKFIRIPNTESLVIVYDQNQEEKYINIEFPRIYAQEGKKYRERWGEELKMHISCEIPEMGVQLHTRCFACRMNATGVFEDVHPGDYNIIINYFSK